MIEANKKYASHAEFREALDKGEAGKPFSDDVSEWLGADYTEEGIQIALKVVKRIDALRYKIATCANDDALDSPWAAFSAFSAIKMTHDALKAAS